MSSDDRQDEYSVESVDRYDEEQSEAIGQVIQEADKRVGFPLFNVLLAFLCLVYMINPTLGLFSPLDLLPDNLPIIGNFDEGVATVVFLAALRNMGVDLFGLLAVKK